MRRLVNFSLAAVGAVAMIAPTTLLSARPPAEQFGGSYASLDVRQQHLVRDWVARFNQVTAQQLEPAGFYDDVMRFSAKTTFEAITNALMTTALSASSGASLGDALDLIERVDGVKGKVLNAPSDRQFRMYVRLKDGAIDTLARSKEFTRRADNTIYHKGYPINYRGQNGPPSIQISIALDRRHADIDVDYRASGFLLAMFNGHLTASNSDVRAGRNYTTHARRWTGLSDWWQNFFGVRVPDDQDVPLTISSESGAPRLGDRPVEDMMEDFLEAWLVDGDVKAAMGYVSRLAFACLAEEGGDPAAFDRGMAPFVLAQRLKQASDALGRRRALDDLVVGVRLTTAGFKTVKQPHHSQFVLYALPDDLAATFECAGDSTTARPGGGRQVYGDYFGATFYIKTAQAPKPIGLLWRREGGYWKIVAWQTDPEDDEVAEPEAPPVAGREAVPTDASLVDAAYQFLDSWLVRKDYDKAFSSISPKAFPCYDLVRAPDQPGSTSLDDAGRKMRAGLERVGREVGSIRSLDDAIAAVPPVHPAVRVMEHRYSRAFALSGVPNALADAIDCTSRSRNASFEGDVPAEYGKAFGLTLRFRTAAGEPPVLRMLWVKDDGVWRITVYDVETP